MEIKHMMTEGEIIYAIMELKNLIEKRKDLMARLQTTDYEQSKVLFELEQVEQHSPNREIEISEEAYILADKVMHRNVGRLLQEELKL